MQIIRNYYQLKIILTLVFLLVTGGFTTATATATANTTKSNTEQNKQIILSGADIAASQAALPEFIQNNKSSHVLFGIYPVYLYDFNLLQGKYSISFYAWWRTKKKDYDPSKSVEITNAANYHSKIGMMNKKIGDEYVTYVHYYADMYKNWDIKKFPFDHQYLDVRLEDFADINNVVFLPDLKQSNLHSELILRGWNIINFYLKDSVTRYSTNFGDISTKEGLYSRLTFVIEIKRQGWRLFFDYFAGFFIAAFLCFMVYLVEPGSSGMSIRSSLALGAVFSFVGNKYILNQVLPFTTDFTLNDSIQLATFILIFISVLYYVLVDAYMHGKNIASYKKINYLLGILFIFIYVSYVGTNTFFAIVS